MTISKVLQRTFVSSVVVLLLVVFMTACHDDKNMTSPELSTYQGERDMLINCYANRGDKNEFGVCIGNNFFRVNTPPAEYLLTYNTPLGTFHLLFQAGDTVLITVGLQAGDTLKNVMVQEVKILDTSGFEKSGDGPVIFFSTSGTAPIPPELFIPFGAVLALIQDGEIVQGIREIDCTLESSDPETPSLPPLRPSPTTAELVVDQNHPNANDSNTCKTPDDPCETIRGALAKASAGYTIYVKAGTYETYSNTYLSLQIPNLSILGEDRDTTIIRSGVYMFYVEAPGATIQGFTFHHSALYGECIQVRESGSSATITGNIITSDRGSGVSVIRGGSANITDNLITNGGIDVRENGSNVIITENTITDKGINITGGGVGEITNNVIDVEQEGVLLSNPGSRAVITRNTITSVNSYGISVESGGTADITNNTITAREDGVFVYRGSANITNNSITVTGRYSNPLDVWSPGTSVTNFANNALSGPGEAISCGASVDATTTIHCDGGNTGITGHSTCASATITGSCP